MKELEIYYDPATDCLQVRVPHAVTAMQLAIAAKAGFDIDCRRYAQSSGAQREVLAQRIAAYRAGRIRQMVAKRGDAELFKATQGTGKIISLGI